MQHLLETGRLKKLSEGKNFKYYWGSFTHFAAPLVMTQKWLKPTKNCLENLAFKLGFVRAVIFLHESSS